jgi:hypothetical protein
MWSWVSVGEGANEASGLTRRAFRVRRKDEVWRRQEKHTHSEVAEVTMEGRNEPLSDWKAIVDEGDVAVLRFLRYSSTTALLCLACRRRRRSLLLSVKIWSPSPWSNPNPDPDLGLLSLHVKDIADLRKH